MTCRSIELKIAIPCLKAWIDIFPLQGYVLKFSDSKISRQKLQAKCISQTWIVLSLDQIFKKKRKSLIYTKKNYNIYIYIYKHTLDKDLIWKKQKKTYASDHIYIYIYDMVNLYHKSEPLDIYGIDPS